MTAAARTRAWRQRRREGRIRVELDLDRAGLEDMLIGAGRLRPELADDIQAVQAALQSLVAELVPADLVIKR